MFGEVGSRKNLTRLCGSGFTLDEMKIRGAERTRVRAALWDSPVLAEGRSLGSQPERTPRSHGRDSGSHHGRNTGGLAKPPVTSVAQ